MDKETARLEDWYFTSNDPYIPPELQKPRIGGTVYGHANERFVDGSKIVTGDILSYDGRIVRSKNTNYLLGEPSVTYREWLRVNRPNWDPDNPVKYI